MQVTGDPALIRKIFSHRKVYGGNQQLHPLVPAKLNELWKDAKPLEPRPARLLRDDIPGRIPYQRYPDSKTELEWKKICHNGQRKLYNTEIHHAFSAMESLDEEIYIIYAGAAPSNKASKYMKLFPNAKFIFIDPNEFLIYYDTFHNYHYQKPGEDVIYMSVSPNNINRNYIKNEDHKRIIKHYLTEEYIDKEEVSEFIGWDTDSMVEFIETSHHQFYLFEEYMTYDVSVALNKLIRDKKKVLFWSDIRTNTQTDAFDFPSDVDIAANAAMNYVWIRALTEGFNGEFYSMLKFRLPYLNEKKSIEWSKFYHQIKEAIDLYKVDWKMMMTGHPLCATIEEEDAEYKRGGYPSKKAMPWLAGKIYIQSYAPFDSAESRLWSNLDDIRSDLVMYDVIEHEDIISYYNMIERPACMFENEFYNPQIGFDHCGDCAIEAAIWRYGLDKFWPTMPLEQQKKFVWEQAAHIGQLTGRPLTRAPHGNLPTYTPGKEQRTAPRQREKRQ